MSTQQRSTPTFTRISSIGEIHNLGSSLPHYGTSAWSKTINNTAHAVSEFCNNDDTSYISKDYEIKSCAPGNVDVSYRRHELNEREMMKKSVDQLCRVNEHRMHRAKVAYCGQGVLRSRPQRKPWGRSKRQPCGLLQNVHFRFRERRFFAHELLGEVKHITTEQHFTAI